MSDQLQELLQNKNPHFRGCKILTSEWVIIDGEWIFVPLQMGDENE
jgi:hypothetical protein